ncbi:MAG: ComF family protein [Desulfobacterota bacterium]|nr:ComF family protein [Thermodesulfobacteriota bacterium]
MLDSLKSVLHLVFPETCAGCGRDGKVFCEDCSKSLSFVEPHLSCFLCGRLIGKLSLCGECLEQERNYSAGFFLYYYTGPVKNALCAFKFEGRKRAGRILVRLSERRILGMGLKFDYIVPIPVTEKKRKERGFNQAYIIAQEISRITRIPILCGHLIKSKETMDQSSLSKKEREKNVKGAFKIRNGSYFKGKKILIVDDLFTTGSTLMEASKVVKLAGADTVCVFALARAI